MHFGSCFLHFAVPHPDDLGPFMPVLYFSMYFPLSVAIDVSTINYTITVMLLCFVFFSLPIIPFTVLITEGQPDLLFHELVHLALGFSDATPGATQVNHHRQVFS